VYESERLPLYVFGVDVAVSTLRAELAHWIEQVRRGEEVVITDRGTPVARLVAVDDAAVSSRLAYPEVRAAPAAAGRDHRLDVDARRQAEAAWEGYWAATRAVELTEDVAARAGQLAGEHALRGADAVHLASALAVGADELLFAAWDQRLRSGAEATGIRLAQ
jgi:prevent-host-death family protein